MKQFIQRFSDKITGVLSGFDRLILRGYLRPISYPYGMKGFLWLNQVMLKDFGRYVDSVSKGATRRQIERTGHRTAAEEVPVSLPLSHRSSVRLDERPHSNLVPLQHPDLPQRARMAVAADG